MSVLVFDLLSSYKKSLQSPSLNKGFFMLIQVKLVVGVVAMVPVKTIVLIVISLLRWGADPLRPFDAWVIPDMEEHLFYGCIKRGIVLKPI